VVAGLARRTRPDSLPDLVVEVDGVGTDLDRLAAYARVCGFRLTDRLPATYPHVLAFPLAMHLMSDASFPFGVLGLVHVANTITQLRPVGVTDRPDLAVHAEGLRAHPRGRQFDLVATATIDGEVVWLDRSTYLHKEPKPPHGEPSEAAAPAEAEPAPSVRPTAGERPAPGAIWRVDRSTGTGYAAVSGDRNPIHVARLGARAFGFPRPIAHGMWSAARALAAMEGLLPDAYTWDVAFRRPILLPSTVAFAASAAGEQRWDLELRGARDGSPHLRGTLGPPAAEA